MKYLCAGYDTCGLNCGHKEPHDRIPGCYIGMDDDDCKCIPMKTREELNEEESK
jgi:hypothetical protein